MSTPWFGASHSATTTLSRRSSRSRWLRGAVLAASGCAASLVLLPASAQAQQHPVGLQRASSVAPGASLAPRSAASSFCNHFPVSKLSAALGTGVSLFEAVAEAKKLECIYFGTKLAISRPEVILSMEPGIPASELATLAKAEARVKAESPKGVALIFTALPAIGKTAFSWTYGHSLNGGQLVGIADNKGTTGYGAAIGGAAKTFGSAAAHLPALERLIALDLAA